MADLILPAIAALIRGVDNSSIIGAAARRYSIAIALSWMYDGDCPSACGVLKIRGYYTMPFCAQTLAGMRLWGRCAGDD